MAPVLSNKEFYPYLIRLSKELLALNQMVDNITAKESAIKNSFDALDDVYKSFADQIVQAESVTKQTAEAASADSKREEENYQNLEKEKSEILAQLREKEETLQAREGTIKDLTEKLQSISEELDRKTADLVKLSEFRDVTLGS